MGPIPWGSPITPGTFECVPNWQLLQFNCFNSFNSYWQLDFNTGGRGSRGNCHSIGTSSSIKQGRLPHGYIPYVLEDKMTIRRAALVTTTAVETFMQAALHRHGHSNWAGCYARIARHSAVPGIASRPTRKILPASGSGRALARAATWSDWSASQRGFPHGHDAVLGLPAQPIARAHAILRPSEHRLADEAPSDEHLDCIAVDHLMIGDP